MEEVAEPPKHNVDNDVEVVQGYLPEVVVGFEDQELYSPWGTRTTNAKMTTTLRRCGQNWHDNVDQQQCSSTAW